jgi:hypothetical protein
MTMRFLIAAALIVAGPAYAQTILSPTPWTEDGKCVCRADGKKWDCRKAKQSYTLCNGGTSKLICSDNRDEPCSYVYESHCSEPPLVDVCYMLDKESGIDDPTQRLDDPIQRFSLNGIGATVATTTMAPSMRLPKWYRLKPKPNISSAELAVALWALSIGVSEEAYTALPPAARRHFEESK